MGTMFTYGTKSQAVTAAEDRLDDDRLSHEIVYWFHKRMTMDQWIRLDTLMEAAIDSALGDDVDAFDVVGVAGPVPLESKDGEDLG